MLSLSSQRILSKKRNYSSKVCLVFPGQGTQYVSMGKARYVIEEVDESLKMSLSRMMFEGCENELTNTPIAQPAIVAHSAMSLAVLKSLLKKRFGILLNENNSVFIGHSVGEFSALFASGAISLSDVVKLVNLRGKMMEKVALKHEETCMHSILPINPTEFTPFTLEAIKDSKFVCDIAAINYPNQVVVSGHSKAIELASALAKKSLKRNIRSIPLKVSAPFHCSLMIPVIEHLEHYFSQVELKPMSIPIISNVNATQVSTTSEFVKLLLTQTISTVLFQNCIIEARRLNANRFVELGPKNNLSSFIQKIDNKLHTSFFEKEPDFEHENIRAVSEWLSQSKG